ncbi:unnamed protein product [Anisakis simplex]|uniref:Fucose-1-phosphate guanylyltransferase (inferred by orthology to a human protein) n=1 Tax=Anisakis simplex TaxID=6269 RepID=A0A0M3J6U1_ANISI|nr:unnamed protein product [Anisakis simplex]
MIFLDHTDELIGKQCEKLNCEELALTDSFYIISMNIADSLIKLLHKTSVTIECETCCYGDYLRPLGESPLWDYLQCSDERLALARKTFADLFRLVRTTECFLCLISFFDSCDDSQIHKLKNFRGKTTEVVQLPRNSFFHFGTIPELLNHFAVASVFLNRFQITDPHKCLYSVLDGSQVEEHLLNKKFSFQIGEKSTVEFCEFNRGAKIGNSCLISSCSSDRHVVAPDGICLTTIILNQDQTRLSFDQANDINQSHLNRFHHVTIAFSIHDNLKQTSGSNCTLQWFSHTIKTRTPEDSLWTVPLFQVCDTASESLQSTISAIQNGPLTTKSDHSIMLLSMEEALRLKNIDEMLKFRKQLKLKELSFQ